VVALSQNMTSGFFLIKRSHRVAGGRLSDIRLSTATSSEFTASGQAVCRFGGGCRLPGQFEKRRAEGL
jgi:hypothetical protein